MTLKRFTWPSQKNERLMSTPTQILTLITISFVLTFGIGCGESDSSKNSDKSPASANLDPDDIHEDWKKLDSAISETQKHHGLRTDRTMSTLKPSWPGPLPDDAPVVSITFDELSQAIEDEDREKATAFVEKHKSSWIEVSGVVGNFATSLSDHFDGSHSISLWLRHPTGYTMFPCVVIDDQIWNKVNTGDNVTLRGTLVPIDESLGGALLVLDNCTLVSEPTNGVESLTVDELLKRLKADPKAFNEKYKEISLIVSGTFQGGTDDMSEFLIAGESGEQVTFDMIMLTELPKETPIKLIGTVRINLDSEGMQFSIGPKGKIKTANGEVEFQLYDAARIDMF